MQDVKPNYTVGDRIRVVNYGSIKFEGLNTFAQPTSNPVLFEDDKCRAVDISPWLIGREGVVTDARAIQGVACYALDGIAGKQAWYFEDQMEKTN